MRSSLLAAVSNSSRHLLLLILRTSEGDDSKGFFIQPTVILTKNPKTVTMVEEIFGPVMTVSNHVSHGLSPADGVLGLRL